jgi:hypothetical protein
MQEGKQKMVGDTELVRRSWDKYMSDCREMDKAVHSMTIEQVKNPKDTKNT